MNVLGTYFLYIRYTASTIVVYYSFWLHLQINFKLFFTNYCFLNNNFLICYVCQFLMNHLKIICHEFSRVLAIWETISGWIAKNNRKQHYLNASPALIIARHK